MTCNGPNDEPQRPEIAPLTPWTQHDRETCVGFLETMLAAARKAVFSLKLIPVSNRPPFVTNSIVYWETVTKGLRWAQGQALQRKVAPSGESDTGPVWTATRKEVERQNRRAAKFAKGQRVDEE